MVCGEPLVYLTQAEALPCNLCGESSEALIKCPNSHHVCDGCHNAEATRHIQRVCEQSAAANPLDIYQEVVQLTSLPMLGCHHAHAAGLACFTAIKNHGAREIHDTDFSELRDRTKRQAVGGYCGLTGVCGIVPALGACFAILLGSKCGTDREQRITMTVVASITSALAELTGPSCCQAYARKALEIACGFLEEHIGITLPPAQHTMRCHDSHRHPHGCRENRCPYHWA